MCGFLFFFALGSVWRISHSLFVNNTILLFFEWLLPTRCKEKCFGLMQCYPFFLPVTADVSLKSISQSHIFIRFNWNGRHRVVQIYTWAGPLYSNFTLSGQIRSFLTFRELYIHGIWWLFHLPPSEILNWFWIICFWTRYFKTMIWMLTWKTYLLCIFQHRFNWTIPAYKYLKKKVGDHSFIISSANKMAERSRQA